MNNSVVKPQRFFPGACYVSHLFREGNSPTVLLVPVTRVSQWACPVTITKYIKPLPEHNLTLYLLKE